MKEITLNSEVKFEGRVFTARRDDIELEDGSKSMRELIIHHGGSSIVALTDDGNLLLVRQFRYALKKEIYEIPAGKLEEGEDPMDCAKRELIEETGYKAHNIELLTKVYPTPGYDTETIYIYKATNLEFVGQHLDPGEFLEVYKVPCEKALSMIKDGTINDGKTIIGILMATKL